MSDFANPTVISELAPTDSSNEDLGALHADGRTIVYVSAAASLTYDVWIACE